MRGDMSRYVEVAYLRLNEGLMQEDVLGELPASAVHRAASQGIRRVVSSKFATRMITDKHGWPWILLYSTFAASSDMHSTFVPSSPDVRYFLTSSFFIPLSTWPSLFITERSAYFMVRLSTSTPQKNIPKPINNAKAPTTRIDHQWSLLLGPAPVIKKRNRKTWTLQDILTFHGESPPLRAHEFVLPMYIRSLGHSFASNALSSRSVV
jgi:hypothetical protein